MPLGREIHDVLRVRQPARFEHEHSSGLNLPARAGCFVCLEVEGIRFLELQGEPAPHDAHAVDRVHERFRVCLQDVAGLGFDHGSAFNNTIAA